MMVGLFYFRGKTFTDFDEFLEYSKYWNDQQCTDVDFSELWEQVGKDIIFNIRMRGLTYTNQEIRHELCETFEFAMRRMGDKCADG